MRAVEGIDVPAGKRVVLAPKGTHIMLMGLAKPLVAGETFPLELRFAKAGELGVTVVVRAAGSDAAAVAVTTLTGRRAARRCKRAHHCPCTGFTTRRSSACSRAASGARN